MSHNDIITAPFLATSIRGLQAHIVQKPGSAGFHASLVIRSGFGDDPPEHPGAAHLAEHERVAFAGECSPGTEFAVRAVTEAAHTIYTVQSSAEEARSALRHLLSMLRDMTADETVVEREKAAISIELKRRFDQPNRLLAPHIAVAATPNEDIAMQDQAAQPQIEALDRDALATFQRGHYTTGNAALAVASGVDTEQLADIVDGEMTAATGARPATPPEYRPEATPIPALDDQILLSMTFAKPCDDESALSLRFARACLTEPGGILDQALGSHATDGAGHLEGRRIGLTVLRCADGASLSRLHAFLSDPPPVDDQRILTAIRRWWNAREFRRRTTAGLGTELTAWVKRETPSPWAAPDPDEVDRTRIRREIESALGALRMWKITGGLPVEIGGRHG